MSKLTLDALKERADGIASEELLAQISGGTENDCHPEEEEPSDALKAIAKLFEIVLEGG